MQMVELRTNVLIGNDHHLINALGRDFNHPLIQKQIIIPFKKTTLNSEKIHF